MEHKIDEDDILKVPPDSSYRDCKMQPIGAVLPRVMARASLAWLKNMEPPDDAA